MELHERERKRKVMRTKNPSYISNGLSGWQTRRAREQYERTHGSDALTCVKLMGRGYRNEEIIEILDINENSMRGYRSAFTKGQYKHILGSNR